MSCKCGLSKVGPNPERALNEVHEEPLIPQVEEDNPSSSLPLEPTASVSIPALTSPLDLCLPRGRLLLSSNAQGPQGPAAAACGGRDTFTEIEKSLLWSDTAARVDPVPRRRSAAAASPVAKANRHCHTLSRAWGAQGVSGGRGGGQGTRLARVQTIKDTVQLGSESEHRTH
uniref:Uncharacterized protein n=1 Tax=Knipowitschia caucasica TaxID=637954 RepID=A0AAV2L7U2_KNICA